jgi:hypothetical protein
MLIERAMRIGQFDMLKEAICSIAFMIYRLKLGLMNNTVPRVYFFD